MPSVVARIRPDREGIREQENLYGRGITPSFDEAGKVVDIRFSELSEPEAADWLDNHGYIDYTLSAGPDEIKEQRHYLAIELAPSADIQEVDGGLLVPGVKLLAPGTWTDSTQKTPCRYTTEILERYHANWTDLSYWSRHSGGTPRDITDRIADIRNVRFEDGVVADLFFHGATTKSLDAISLLKAAAAKKVPWPFSSVEMYTRDKWIISEKIYEAQEVLFDGAAMVNQGACRVCRIRNNEWVQEDPVFSRELASVPGNPAGAKIGENAEDCKLTEESFGDMSFSEIRKRFAYDGNGKGEQKFTALKLPHHSVDGTVRPNCVRSALQAIGGARQDKPMDLGGKEAAVKAHLESHLDAINKDQKKEQQYPAGSLEDRRTKVQPLITDKFGKTGDNGEKYGAWIIATFVDKVLIEDPDGAYFEVPYTLTDDGNVTLGDPTEIELTYAKKQQESEMTENKELEAAIAAATAPLLEKIKELEAAQKPPADPPKTEIPKELAEKMEAQERTIKELSDRLEKFEKAPGDPKTKGKGGDLEEKELSEAPEYCVPVDRRAGIVGGD